MAAAQAAALIALGNKADTRPRHGRGQGGDQMTVV